MPESRFSGVYKDLPRLETPRLILRKVTLDDLEDMFAYSSDEETTRFLRWGPHKTLADTENYLREVLRQYERDQDGPWGVEHKQTGRLIGAIHLMAINAPHSKAEIGFVLSRPYWNKGLMSEALARVLGYAFESIGLNRVEGFCLVDNLAGMRVLEKAGMKQQGVLREHLFQKGAFRDFCLYAVLKRDYEGT
jgi:ribosomal-protein-alanine N-acetyltransferase